MPNWISPIVTLIGVVVSGVLSYFVALSTANKEMEKLKLSWKRDDKIAFDEKFADMASAVTKSCMDYSSVQRRTTAREKVASVRVLARGELGKTLDSLYDCLDGYIYTPDQTEALLNAAIEQNRQQEIEK